MAVTDHERVTWGAALSANLEALTELHPIVVEQVERLKEREVALEAASKAMERERSEEGDALGSLSSANDDAVRRARLIGVKLEAAFLESKIEDEVYRAALNAAFPRGPMSVGTAPAERYEALKAIVEAFARYPDADPSGELAALAAEGAAAIEAANANAKREQEESREANEALDAARHAFDRTYQATKEIVGGLLREAERLAELRDVFPDM